MFLNCSSDSTKDTCKDVSGLRIPFARTNDGFSIHIGHASLAKGPFYCLECGDKLLLKAFHSNHMRAHFAHVHYSACKGETALHLFAKELLVTERVLTLPSVVADVTFMTKVHQDVVQGGRLQMFDDAVPEVSMDGLKPDVICVVEGVKLAVEFRVSHAVDETKAAKFAALGLPCVEIDLNGFDAYAGEDDGLAADRIEQFVLHEAKRTWIYHPLIDEGRRQIEARLDRDFPVARRHAASQKLAAAVQSRIWQIADHFGIDRVSFWNSWINRKAIGETGAERSAREVLREGSDMAEDLLAALDTLLLFFRTKATNSLDAVFEGKWVGVDLVLRKLWGSEADAMIAKLVPMHGMKVGSRLKPRLNAKLILQPQPILQQSPTLNTPVLGGALGSDEGSILASLADLSLEIETPHLTVPTTTVPHVSAPRPAKPFTGRRHLKSEEVFRREEAVKMLLIAVFEHFADDFSVADMFLAQPLKALGYKTPVEYSVCEKTVAKALSCLQM